MPKRVCGPDFCSREFCQRGVFTGCQLNPDASKLLAIEILMASERQEFPRYPIDTKTARDIVFEYATSTYYNYDPGLRMALEQLSKADYPRKDAPIALAFFVMRHGHKLAKASFPYPIVRYIMYSDSVLRTKIEHLNSIDLNKIRDPLYSMNLAFAMAAATVAGVTLYAAMPILHVGEQYHEGAKSDDKPIEYSDTEFAKDNTTKPETLAELRQMYQILARKLHPDKGGSVDGFTKLGNEYARLKEEYKIK